MREIYILEICLNPELAHFTMEHKNIFYFIFYIFIKTVFLLILHFFYFWDNFCILQVYF